MPDVAIRPAFNHSVRQSQAAFRTVMDAMARPGRMLPLEQALQRPLR